MVEIIVTEMFRQTKFLKKCYLCLLIATRCSDLHSCKDCQSNPLCGWCNDPSNTGIGRCVEGGASGPVNQTNHQMTDLSICPISQWYFVDCPGG